MRLTAPDEYFHHQVSLPHAMVGSSDPSWRERYWISIQDTERKDTVLTCGFGQYPNQDVQEAFVVLAQGERQTNLRLARELSQANDVLHVGPFSIKVDKPLEQLHLVLDDNPSGVSFDLRWTGTMEPVLEGRHYQVSRNRAIYDAIRYVQVGRASGTLRTPTGEERSVESETWWGERDHSWGTRPLPRTEGAPPGARPEWRMLMFCPIQLPDFGLHFYLYEAEPGRPLHLSAGISRPITGDRPGSGVADEAIVGVEHDLRWLEGAAHSTLVGGTIVVSLANGRKLPFEVTALTGRAHLRGGGYEGWNGWFQGHWKGENSLEHDTWDLSDASQFYRYAKASSDHLIEVRLGDQVGYGVMEYMVLPGYSKYPEAVPPKPQRKSS